MTHGTCDTCGADQVGVKPDGDGGRHCDPCIEAASALDERDGDTNTLLGEVERLRRIEEAARGALGLFDKGFRGAAIGLLRDALNGAGR